MNTTVYCNGKPTQYKENQGGQQIDHQLAGEKVLNVCQHEKGPSFCEKYAVFI
jgi:hypothetical protein